MIPHVEKLAKSKVVSAWITADITRKLQASPGFMSAETVREQSINWASSVMANVIMEFVLQMVSVLQRIIVKLLAITNFRPIKVTRVVSVVMDFVLRMVELFKELL
jgi:hypothetical protein